VLRQISLSLFLILTFNEINLFANQSTISENKFLPKALKDLENISLLHRPNCLSHLGESIYHYQKMGVNPEGKKILVLSQIHGDEPEAGILGIEWIKRLERLSPQNSWRIIPLLNPDGKKNKTRTNAQGIDLNRNFPTKDWKELAASEWKKKQAQDPRRFPGKASASEKEVLCAVEHIEDFKPDLVVSIHTPYGILDFDGPKEKRLNFSPLPWKSFGTFPGSLGRYLWVERKIPTLTIELHPGRFAKDLPKLIVLQDQMSYLTND